MPSQAKQLFDKHLCECREAIALYEHLEKTSVYRADFNLRFVWIAAVSAFDHYLSQLILERATAAYANTEPLTPKLLSDSVTFSNALELQKANPIDSILVFKDILGACIKYKSFQHPDKIADGLAYIWHEKHKWDCIAKALGASTESVKGTLEGIIDRRNLIAHNADYDEARKDKLPVTKEDAFRVIDFFERFASVLDSTIYPPANVGS